MALLALHVMKEEKRCRAGMVPGLKGLGLHLSSTISGKGLLSEKQNGLV